MGVLTYRVKIRRPGNQFDRLTDLGRDEVLARLPELAGKEFRAEILDDGVSVGVWYQYNSHPYDEIPPD